MSIRLFVLAFLAVSLPASACDNMIVGDASRPDRASQRFVETLVGPVRARFAALSDASRCRQEDNRYAYRRLLSKLSGAGQAMLEQAASKGVDEGRSVGLKAANADSEADKCKAAIDRLRAADDELLVLSERVPG